ncbi:MAG TPA: alpha/beta fold hydrolase [Bacillus sp. (in: firmicutes)]|uniref:alpha/beta hydrolase n=1 Tax=Bacillus litorisediminis TaxID=2922713 RepID=UPI001FAF586F|nr:alpha/beta fold hydrolase [Bacillus litorisediminis]HWO74459.1 alpha/beta fold hydrolase [Bacillus sp. (in: firmicutes)]
MYIWIISTLMFLVAFAGLVWKLAVISQTPRKTAIDTKPDFPFEQVTFKSGTEKMAGWFIPAKTNPHEKSPLIILVHGWGSNRAKMKRYVKPIFEAGYALLLFDVRSHGESEEINAPTVKTFRDDVLAAVQYAKTKKEVDPERIGILAHSFGGFGSILANQNDIGVQAIVSDSSPAQISTIMKAALNKYKLPYFPFGPLISKIMFVRAGIQSKELKEFDVIHALRERKSPVLLIHSKRDDYVPSTELDFIIENVDLPHLYVDSKGHRSSESDSQFWPYVLPFFKQHLE